jgi:hypothetical protein
MKKVPGTDTVIGLARAALTLRPEFREARALLYQIRSQGLQGPPP